MYTGDEHDVEWYVIFTTSSYNHFIMPFLNKDIRHCYAVARHDEYTWVVVNTSYHFTKVNVISAFDYPHIRSIVGEDAKIVKVSSKLGRKNRNMLCYFNCVEVVKSLLGIKRFFIWTPYQLYRYLL